MWKNGVMHIHVPKEQVDWFLWVIDEGIAGSDPEVFSSDKQEKAFDHFNERGIQHINKKDTT